MGQTAAILRNPEARIVSNEAAPVHYPRIVVLCCDGEFQKHLVRKLHNAFHVSGVVFYREARSKGSLGERLRRYIKPGNLARYLIARWDMRRTARAATPVVSALFDGHRNPEVPRDIDIEFVDDINTRRSVDFVVRHAPDIVCVNGTNLLRRPMLDLSRQIPLGIINLHTGLSPYTRGGNCNLFALLEGRPEWVGVTIHYIDPGIDSGDLILTAQVPMDAEDNYDVIDARTFRCGIDLLEKAVRQIVEGSAERVPQWHEGRLYLRRTGFVYEPYQRYRVNRLLKDGLLREYLANKEARDSAVRLVGAPC